MSTSIFEAMAQSCCEELIFYRDAKSGLRAVIALSDNKLGPAAGGVRRMSYKSEQEAIDDVLRLSKAMTHKFAANGCNIGGGKVVILDNPQNETESIYRALGRYIQSRNGRYHSGPDVGTSMQALQYMRQETSYTLGFPEEHLEKTSAGVQTARGVAQGIRACLNEVFGNKSASGKTIGIQGMGEVGYNLAKELYREGANIIATDIEKRKVDQVVSDLGIKAVNPDDIYDIQCDVFAPCAMGGILNENTIPRLKCSIVAGAANNQIYDDKYGDMLHKRGILYAPDFIINAGAVLYDVDCIESGVFNREKAEARVLGIFDKVTQVIKTAKQDRIPTYKAAMIIAGKWLKDKAK